MTDTNRLNEMIKKSGYKVSFIAKELNLSPYGFSRKRDNLSEFTPSEINKLCDILKISKLEDRFSIFFAEEVDGKSTNDEALQPA